MLLQFWNSDLSVEFIEFKDLTFFNIIKSCAIKKVLMQLETFYNNTIKKAIRYNNVKFNRFFLTILKKIQTFIFIKKTICNV